MKELKVLILVSLCLISISLFSQVPCFPDITYTQPGFYPDTIQNLPPATAGIYYEEIITVVVPVDTNINQIGKVPIDSIRVDSIKGLPIGFNWGCHNIHCVTPGGSSGCTVIFGMPHYTQIGEHYLDVFVTLFGRLFGTVPIAYHTVIKSYKIVITPNNPCIPDVNSTNLWFNPQFTGNIDTGFVGNIFSKSFTIRTPDKYFINQNFSDVDSVVILGFSGFPSSIKPYFTNNINSIPGNSLACVLFEGIPQSSEQGTHNVSANIRIYSNSTYKDTVITNYVLLIIDNSGLSNENILIDEYLIYPNPFYDFINILSVNEKKFIKSYEIYDLSGRIIRKEIVFDNKLKIELKNIEKGCYILRLKDNNSRIVIKKLIKLNY